MSTAKDLFDEAQDELIARIREAGQLLLSEHEYTLLRDQYYVWRIRVVYDTTKEHNTLYWGAVFHKIDVTQFVKALEINVKDVTDYPPIASITIT